MSSAKVPECITGGCVCGNCRCDNCRKRGTLVATNLAVPEANFAWTSSTTLKEFPPNSPEGHALFCSNCGSCFAGWKKGHGNAVPVGTIDREFLMGPGGQLLAEPKLHFFTEREIKNVTDEGVMSRGKRMNKMFE